MPWNKDGTRKESAFYLKSGNTTPFKQMGSSPLKQDYVKDIYHAKFNPTGVKGRPPKVIHQDVINKELTIELLNIDIENFLKNSRNYISEENIKMIF